MKRIESLVRFLWFWQSLPDRTKKGDDKAAWVAETRDSLGKLDPASTDAFITVAKGKADEQLRTREWVSARGGSLLVFVAVISAGASLVNNSIGTATRDQAIAIALLAIGLLYSVLATAFLAVRAQQVAAWDQPSVELDLRDENAIKLAYATDLFVSGKQNGHVLRNQVAYLRDAQTWARAALCGLILLVAASVYSGAWTASSSQTQSPTPPPAGTPSLGPSPT